MSHHLRRRRSDRRARRVGGGRGSAPQGVHTARAHLRDPSRSQRNVGRGAPGGGAPRTAARRGAGVAARSLTLRQTPRRGARELARAVESGQRVGEALRHLDSYGSEPDAPVLAEALARFLVARCESHHAGWRVVRQIVVDSAANAPWEKCARRAVPLVAADLLNLSAEEGRTPLHRAQHLAARRRAEKIAGHLDHAAVLAALGLEPVAVDEDRWREAIGAAVVARSREQVSRAIAQSLSEG